MFLEWLQSLRLTSPRLLQTLGTLEVTAGALAEELQHSGAGSGAGSLPDAAKQFLGLFPGDPDHPPSFELFGEQLVTFQKTEAAAYALSPGRRVGVCVNNLSFGVLVSTFARPKLPQEVVPLLEAACDQLRR